MNWTLLLACLALAIAGLACYTAGYRAGLQWNRDVIRADARHVAQLRGQVAILTAGMVTDYWDDFDRSGP